MYLPLVFVGLGANIGDSLTYINRALEKIARLPNIQDLRVSRFYSTTPVSSIPQDPYINAACCFTTAFSARELLYQLQDIEKSLGKTQKIKDAPRVIDLDILFYGLETYHEPDLQVPHPHWSKRLFVLAPLADLVTHLQIPDPKNPPSIISFDVQTYLQNFPNIHHEKVVPISKT